MQELLTGKKRLPGFSGEWEVKKLGDVANIQRGASPRPIDSPIWYDKTSSVGWVRISDITASNGRILKKTKDYLSHKGIAQSRFLPAGSLIMSICATVGTPVITNIDTCIHDGFVGLTKLNNIDQIFFYYKLKELENNFKSMGQTGSQNNLNTNLVKEYIIPLPPLPEQKAIAKILTEMDEEIEALEKKREKYKNIKQGMMQE
ncbi:MAG: restriction endonuclease subunit S, partial [Sphaerospermopsis kisseleviana]